MTARTAPVHTEKTMCRVSPTRMTPRVPSVSLYALFQVLLIDLPALLMTLILIAALPSCLVPVPGESGCFIAEWVVLSSSVGHQVITCQPCSSDVYHKEKWLTLYDCRQYKKTAVSEYLYRCLSSSPEFAFAASTALQACHTSGKSGPQNRSLILIPVRPV